MKRIIILLILYAFDLNACDTLVLNQLESVIALKEQSVKIKSVKIKSAYSQLYVDIINNYCNLDEHLKNLILNESMFDAQLLEFGGVEYVKVVKIFKKQINYVIQKHNQKELLVLINASPDYMGGQYMYLIDLTTKEIIKTKISTAYKGIGFINNSDKTPLGYFEVDTLKPITWGSYTILGGIYDLYRKIEKQEWGSYSNWLHRVDTELEKAYINSNQFGLNGLCVNELVPLNAHKDLYMNDTIAIDNSNSVFRNLYIHGTNRLDQLGFNLSGGCVRVNNLFSFILQHCLMNSSNNKLSVFIDYANMKTPIEIEMDIHIENDPKLLPYSVYTSINFYYKNTNISNPFNKNISEIDSLIKQYASNYKYVNVELDSYYPLFDGALVADTLKEDSLYYDWIDLDKKYLISVNKVKKIMKGRIALATEKIDDIVEKYPDNTINISINEPQIVLKQKRDNVRKYYNYLDSLKTNDIEIFNRQKELKWLNDFIINPIQIKNRVVGYKTYYDTLKVNDAFLVQSYIYLMGEHYYYKRKLKYGEDYQNNLEMFDSKGVELLSVFINKTTKNNYGYKVGELKSTKNLYGTLMFLELFFSKYKISQNSIAAKLYFYNLPELEVKIVDQ